MKEYTSTVTITFSLNYNEAQSKEDYIEKTKAQFSEQYGIDLMDCEITDIEEVKQQEVA
jgi:hypothetical protein